MVGINPQAQLAEDRIGGRYLSILVAAIIALIENPKRQKTILGFRCWLRRHIPEEFPSIIDRIVVIAIKNKKPCMTGTSNPGRLLEDSVCIDIKSNSIVSACEIDAITCIRMTGVVEHSSSEGDAQGKLVECGGFPTIPTAPLPRLRIFREVT